MLVHSHRFLAVSVSKTFPGRGEASKERDAGIPRLLRENRPQEKRVSEALREQRKEATPGSRGSAYCRAPAAQASPFPITFIHRLTYP